MLDWIEVLNVACSAGLCMCTGWVIVTPRVHEGPIIKAGLVLLAVGLFGVSLLIPRLADQPPLRPLMHALLIGNTGVLVVAAGMAWRIYKRPEARAAAVALTGWPAFDDARPADPLT